MRIVCGKCQAAYAIDDRLISPRGVRAQCPRCRHLQLVTKEGPVGAVGAFKMPPENHPGGPAPQPATTPVSTPRVPPEAFPTGPVPAAARPNDANRPPAVMPAVAPPVAPLNPASPPARPPPAAPASPPPPSPQVGIDDSLLTGGATREATMGCRECGTPLTDAFDQALGICDRCRTKADAAVNGPVQPEPKGAGRPKPPTSMAALDAALDAAMSESAQTPAPERPRPMLNQGFVMTASREEASGGRGKWVVLGLLLVLLGAGGAAAWAFRERLFAPNRNEATAAIPPAIEQALAAWRMAFVEISGTASEHLATGQRLLAQDTTAGYDHAIEAFQKALLLDPRSDAAIAGYVRALALGRGAHIDDAAWKEARALIAAAEKRSHRAPEVVLAHAHLLLARADDPSNAAEARALAESVLETTKEPSLLADAHLLVGRSWQSSSSALAVESFTRALTLDPKLPSALYQRALAYEASGDLGAALGDLNARLAIDPAHWASNQALARIYRDAGHLDLARQVYLSVLKEHPDHTAAKLELAVFRYQTEGRLPEALGALREMARSLDRYDEHDQVEILTHLATSERLAGNENAAVDAARRAVKIAPDDPAPHVQLFLIALWREAFEEAGAELAAFSGRLGDPGLEKLLEGRLRMSEQKWAEAQAAFDAAVAADARRIDAQLLGAVAAANGGDTSAALKRLAEAAKADPARPPGPPPAERLYVQPLGLLRGFEDRIAHLSKGPDDLAPKLYEAVYRYRLGDAGAAARLSAQVTRVDENNAVALAWQSFALLAAKDVRGAAQAGERAVAANRSVALAQYALGSALLAEGKNDEARRPLQEALRLDPSLLGAEQALAELSFRRQEVDAARGRLTHILSLDPSWKLAKQLLFALEKEVPREGAGPR
ncbi:MAG: zinc-ribbon domain-containing protein [Myxococcaceae bacterium]|nr:zinc-ribbon domain-containing protein [Myxococcaceae bacterium]